MLIVYTVQQHTPVVVNKNILFRWLIGIWTLGAFVLSASYCGMIKAAMMKPTYTKPIDTVTDVYESGLPVEIMDCLEFEGHISEDTDPIVQHVYGNRIRTNYTPWLQGGLIEL